MIPIGLENKQQLPNETHLGKSLSDVEFLVATTLQQGDEMLQMHTLDILVRLRPKLEIERNGSVCNCVDYGRLAVWTKGSLRPEIELLK